MRLPFKGLYILTQAFGVNPQYYAKFLVKHPDGTRKPMLGHNGLDFGTPHRTEIIAPHHGKVIEALSDPNGYGFYVKVENNQEGSVLAHLDAIDVKVGFELQESDHIGWSDSTGNSTGPHLHWGYYRTPRDRNNGLAGFIDQSPYLLASGIKLVPGALPELATTAIQTPKNEENGNSYKGIDLNNLDSVKAAIDAWYDVAHGKYKTVEDFNALSIQLESVKEQLINTQRSDENMSVDLKNYNKMKALGYTTVDDVIKSFKEKDDLILSLQTENAQVRARNSILASEIQKMEEEDHTTADLGRERVYENEQLNGVLKEAAKILELEKNTPTEVLKSIYNLKDQADRLLSIPVQTQIKEKIVNNIPVKKGSDFLLNLFGLNNHKEEGVK